MRQRRPLTRYDQVVWLWISLEALAPSASVVTLIDGLVERASRGRGILRSFFEAAADEIRRLIVARRRLATYDHVSDSRLVAALRAPAPDGMACGCDSQVGALSL